MPLSPDQQRALVTRLTAACGGSYTPEERRKYFITGPQWAAAYDGNAIFHAPTRQPVSFETVIENYARLGIGFWTTHDTDVIPYADLGKDGQHEIVARIDASLKKNGVACSMVTTETFHHAVFAGGPAGEQSEVREYAKWRLRNTVSIGHELGASFVVYWPGSLGYQFQGIVDEVQTLKWFADGMNAACDADIEIAAAKGRPTMKHCMEAKPFEPQAEILLPTSDAMLAWIFSGQLKHPDMVGLNPEYLHELMWGGAVRASLARALLCNKLFHFDINDGYRLKHDVDIAVGLVNPFDWLNVLVLLRTYNYQGPFNLDFKPPRTTSNDGVFDISFPTAVDRFITLWEMAGEVMSDPILNEAGQALREGSGIAPGQDANAIFEANKELWSLHELIAHRLFQILVGAHRGRVFSVPTLDLPR